MHGYPPTVNHKAQTDFAVGVATEIAGKDMVIDDFPPFMEAEDFAYMLEARPGAYLSIGQGEGPTLHHPEYNFNDELSPIGASYFVKLVETAQPLVAG
ncbi:MAG: amidohydrolase [Alphaproteobacteria bacterium]|nr:amidohydrolase [Alphaproteobacteria bacterium]